MNRSYSNRSRSLFVRWVSYDTRPYELHSLFSKYGDVNDVYIPRDYYTNKPRGFAYIEFENIRDAQAAVRDSGTIKLNGRYLDIEFAQGNRKTPFEMKDRFVSDRNDDDYNYRRESRRRSSSSLDRRSNRRNEWNRSRSRSRSHSRNRDKRQRSISPKYSKSTSDFRENRKYDSDKHKRYRVNGPMGGLELGHFY